MLHGFKTTAVLAATLLTAAACSSGTESAQAGFTSAQSSASELKASPVDLAVLATLSGNLDAPRLATAQQVPAEAIAPRIVPAKTATFEADTLIDGEVDAEFDSGTLPVIHEDSDLLKGTVYYGTSFSAPPKKRIVPGTWRTYEYKK